MPYYTLFSATLFMGTLMCLSSNHWIYIWMGFEINLMSFIPLILHNNTNQETEAAVKYFLAQALGSSLILLSSFSLLFHPFSSLPTSLALPTLVFAMMTKMGAAPFHFWLPQVMNSISWASCMILATWQKIAPLFILCSASSVLSNKFVMLTAMTGTLIGGLGGLNQTHLRPLLAYSSIGHLGWMIAATSISLYATASYFSIYSLMTLAIMYTLHSHASKNNFISSMNSISSLSAFSLMVLFLSLGGLPPLLGFFPKWLMIKFMIYQNMLTFLIIMIVGSLISLFYYLSLFFNLFTNSILSSMKTKLGPSGPLNMSVIATTTLGLIPLIM
uniref:NADH-ubiquinone oxidoreductase chain 2 n=1 Tax=Glycera unicornis TaxID=529288 RepID=A0A0U2X6L2_9ANNE|nr:NADH dehydrogenase subunit 2 [Glycera unicornis]